MRVLCVIVKSALCVALVPLLAAGQKLDPDLIHKLERAVADEMSADSIPALAIAVATNGELLWSAAYGFQDLENFTPAKPVTAFRLALISKPLTAVLALRLASAGRLDLDAPIQSYVPAFPTQGGTVTPRLLLAHLSGVRHYRDYSEINAKRHFRRLADALVLFQDDPLIASPGTRFGYTTFGYTLLGAAIEAACGQPFGECLREWVLSPAGMERTAVDDIYALVPNRARGYGRDRSGRVINTDFVDTSNKIPGGGLLSTAEDLVRFALAVQSGKLLNEEMRTSMWTSQTLLDGTTTDYGLGWSIMQKSPIVVGHGGGQAGATAMLLVDPGRNIVVAVLCNMEQARGLTPFAEQILQLLSIRAR